MSEQVKFMNVPTDVLYEVLRAGTVETQLKAVDAVPELWEVFEKIHKDKASTVCLLVRQGRDHYASNLLTTFALDVNVHDADEWQQMLTMAAHHNAPLTMKVLAKTGFVRREDVVHACQVLARQVGKDILVEESEDYGEYTSVRQLSTEEYAKEVMALYDQQKKKRKRKAIQN